MATMKKKVHPSSPKKRNMLYDVASSSSSSYSLKKLRRLPHVFANVLELPFHSNADVSVEETSHSFRFTAATTTKLITDQDDVVRAHTIEICPGVTKIVVRKKDGGDLKALNKVVVDDLDLWRYRLPPSTRPELASATWSGRKLAVTVPKEHVCDDNVHNKLEEQEDEVLGDENGGLILVQYVIN